MMNRVLTGKIASMYLLSDPSLMEMAVVSPEGGHWRTDTVIAPVNLAPMYHLGMEVLIDCVEHKILVQ